VPNPFLENKVLLALLVVATLALGGILLPFWGSLMWATIIALLFAPVHRRLLARWPGHPNLCALLTLTLVLVIVILPFLAMVAALARETALFYGQLQSGEINPERFFQSVFMALPDWVTKQLTRLGLVDFDALRRTLTTALSRAGEFMATQALSIGQNTVEFIASLFITTYLAYFLIRDGEDLAHTLRRAVPLASSHRQELVLKFTTVIRATVKGNLLVAAIQGALGGLAFWFLNVAGALLWAVVMALLSMLPAVGAALVWVPVAIYFLVAGEIWQAVALAAWGVLVIGLVDNVLRPILVGRDTRMPDYVVLVSTLGGMSVFGINGFVLGPAIAAMFMAIWHIRLSGEAPPRPRA
jgi:predicted PurR-regulated permease PerM